MRGAHVFPIETVGFLHARQVVEDCSMGNTQPLMSSGINGHASDIRLLRVNSGDMVNLGSLQHWC